MASRFFVDENDLGLGKALAEANYGVVYPGHVELPDVQRGSVDDEWLQVVGAQRLSSSPVTGASGTGPSSGQMWVAHPVRGFVLTGTASQSTGATDLRHRHPIAEEGEGSPSDADIDGSNDR